VSPELTGTAATPLPRSVLRTALQPKWLGVLAVVLALCVAFTFLGRWQLDVARSKEKPKHPHVLAAAPLEQVVGPQQTFRNNMLGRPVTVAGQYDAGRQLLVSGKRLGGAKGFWVLTALRVPSGALVPVVRGFVPTAAAASVPPAPSGAVRLNGVLEAPDAAPAGGDGPTVPAGQIPAADTADVVNLWGSPIYNVLVVADAGSSPSSGVLRPVPPPSASQGGGLDLRNAAYAVQWWIFGLFALLLWWRMVRQDAVESALAAGPAPTKELSPS
jgi:cytochrome oxidase assembly protein ShyY1